MDYSAQHNCRDMRQIVERSIRFHLGARQYEWWVIQFNEVTHHDTDYSYILHVDFALDIEL